LNDVGVVESGRETRLVEEHLVQLWLVRNAPLQRFEDDEFAEAARPACHRQVHRRRPTFAELRKDSIFAILAFVLPDLGGARHGGVDLLNDYGKWRSPLSLLF
jgi:hypothetical protein